MVEAPSALARGSNLALTTEHMTIPRMEHVGIVVDDLRPRLSSYKPDELIRIIQQLG